MPYKIFLTDDHPLLLMGIQRALDAEDDFEVVGTARTGSEALPMIGRTEPDVVLLDIRMPDLDGLACLTRLRTQAPNVKAIILSMFDDAEHVEQAFARGAAGYIVKTIAPSELPGAIRRVLQGAATLIQPRRESNAAGEHLTTREARILGAVARGLSNQAIARELWVTEQTVKFHLTNIYRKLSVSNRTQAARYAYERGLVQSAR